MNTPEYKAERLNYSVLLVIVIGTFMAILDGTIVNVGLPRIITIFNSSTEHAQWVVTAYMLTLGIIMPISGYLGDRFGYKRIYFFALAVFVLGSGLCGMAWSINSLIIFRVIQALGGGIMQPLGMAILYQNYPRDKMGMVLGIWGIAVMAAPAVGPTLGGYLVDYINWRFVFYLNVPVGIINLFLATMYLKPTTLVKGKDFDLIGILFSS
jgi:EmrB/QacA subfamily drug resistance transporter